MNCDGVRGLLSAYLDGELSPGELLRVEQHLRRCHCCADEVDALRQTIALVKTLDEVEVPATFRASLHERLVALGPPMPVRKVPVARPWQRQLRTWALPAAAAAAVLAVGIGQVNRLGTVDPGLITQRVVSVDQPAPTQTPVAAGPTGGTNAPVQTPGPGKDVAVNNPTDGPTNPPTSSENKAKDNGSGGVNSIDTTTAPTPAPKGKLSSVLEIHTASLVEHLTEPQSLPAMVAKTYGVTAKVAEPAAAVGSLKSAFSSAAEVTAVGRADIVTSVVISVPVKDAEGALANIRTLLGQNVVEEASSSDLAPEINQAFERLTNLDSVRERTLNQAEGVTDADRVAVFKASLEQIEAQAKVQREQYERMQTRVSSVTITVYLQK